MAVPASNAAWHAGSSVAWSRLIPSMASSTGGRCSASGLRRGGGPGSGPSPTRSRPPSKPPGNDSSGPHLTTAVPLAGGGKRRQRDQMGRALDGGRTRLNSEAVAGHETDRCQVLAPRYDRPWGLARAFRDPILLGGTRTILSYQVTPGAPDPRRGTLKMRVTTLTGWTCHTWSHPGGSRTQLAVERGAGKAYACPRVVPTVLRLRQRPEEQITGCPRALPQRHRVRPPRVQRRCRAARNGARAAASERRPAAPV